MTDRPLDFLAALIGHEIPGGCDDCDAYQSTTRHESGSWILTVHHDEDCNFLTGLPRGLRK